MHELAHVVADHAHADFLVEDLLQLFGQRDTLHRQAVELDAEFGELGFELLRQRVGKHDLVRREVEEWQAAAGDGVADVLQHQATQLAVQVRH